MTDRPKKRVLFVCFGNACRSQMAEGFARYLGSDCMVPASAGLYPAYAVAPDTIRAMNEKEIDVREHFPKGLKHLGKAKFDVIVNMSDRYLPPETGVRLIEWEVPDPIDMDYEDHCKVRDLIERKVMELVLEMRSERDRTQFRGQGSGRREF